MQQRRGHDVVVADGAPGRGRLRPHWGKALRMAFTSSATAVRANSNCSWRDRGGRHEQGPFCSSRGLPRAILQGEAVYGGQGRAADFRGRWAGYGFAGGDPEQTGCMSRVHLRFCHWRSWGGRVSVTAAAAGSVRPLPQPLLTPAPAWPPRGGAGRSLPSF